MSPLPRMRSFLSALFRRRQIEADMEAEWRAHLEAHVDALVAPACRRTTPGVAHAWTSAIRCAGRSRRSRCAAWVGQRSRRRHPARSSADAAHAGVHGDRAGDAGRGHRTQHRGLQRDRCGPGPPVLSRSERVLWITTVDRDQEMVNSVDFLAWKEQATSFDGLVAFDFGNYAIYTADNVVQSRVAWVSEDFWAVSGARPMLGRLPLRGEDAVLLSYPFFVTCISRRFSVAGRVTINDARSRSPACCPPDFRPQLTRPFAWNGLQEKAIDAYRPLTVTPPTKAPNGATITQGFRSLGS